MRNEDADISAQLQILLDKQAISEVLYRRSRASDRCDIELALSCYHADATEVHPGSASVLAHDFITKHSAMVTAKGANIHMMYHGLLNMLIDVDGDSAFAETYNIAMHREKTPDGDIEYQIGGRLLDSFERRDGRWAIAHREIVMDWSHVAPVGPQFWDNLSHSVVLGSRSGDDALYRYIRRGGEGGHAARRAPAEVQPAS